MMPTEPTNQSSLSLNDKHIILSQFITDILTTHICYLFLDYIPSENVEHYKHNIIPYTRMASLKNTLLFHYICYLDCGTDFQLILDKLTLTLNSLSGC